MTMPDIVKLKISGVSVSSVSRSVAIALERRRPTADEASATVVKPKSAKQSQSSQKRCNAL